MTIDPSKVPPEVYLLSMVERLDQRIQNVEKTLDRIEATVNVIKESHAALGWKVSGALASALGALVAAAWNLIHKP
jgi:hypothetical protein